MHTVTDAGVASRNSLRRSRFAVCKRSSVAFVHARCALLELHAHRHELGDACLEVGLEALVLRLVLKDDDSTDHRTIETAQRRRPHSQIFA